jgi:SAM-dependent methyltransferase
MGAFDTIIENLRSFITREVEDRLNKRADVYEKSVDARIDERLGAIEHRLDNRLDDRLERHERKVDTTIRRMSIENVERCDIMLRLFEERLDKQRRAIRAIRQALDFNLIAGPGVEQSSAQEDDERDSPASNGGAPNQPISFQRLANTTNRVGSKTPLADGTVLYHQILAWKKVAHEGIDHFPPDEQEMVDYILSFIDDPKEAAYFKTHMRRLISTLQRIPPAQSSADRLLELGSRSPLAPAIRRYSGYNEIFGVDVWESAEKLIRKTVRQKNGTDSYTFEVRNFNVERDPFPYPDNFFQVVLCCELIEHLRRDPMHMLWECNRVLAEGGYLILTTPNITSARAIEAVLLGCTPYLYSHYNINEVLDQHRREYAPREIGEALAAAGFTVDELETQDVWLRSNPAIIDLLEDLLIPTELRGDNIFVRGRKTGAPVERYPKSLYVD